MLLMTGLVEKYGEKKKTLKNTDRVISKDTLGYVRVCVCEWCACKFRCS